MELKLAANRETFTATVKYETKELYGKIEAARTFTIASD